LEEDHRESNGGSYRQLKGTPVSQEKFQEGKILRGKLSQGKRGKRPFLTEGSAAPWVFSRVKNWEIDKLLGKGAA